LSKFLAEKLFINTETTASRPTT